MLLILLLLLIVGVGLLLYGWWDTRRFTVARREILLDRLPPAFDGFTVLQVSDLHNCAYGKDKQALLRAIKDLSFDCIVITGDLLDRHLPHRRSNAYAFLEGVCRLGRVYVVQGNHERVIPDWEKTKADFVSLGARVLENETLRWEREGQTLALTGIKDKEDWKIVEKCLLPDVCTVMLAHRPETLPAYASLGVDLVLVGHAHGGQVRVFGQGLFSPDQGPFPRYTSGVYTKGKTKMFVSRGAGNHSFLPPRIFNRPEINLITLKTPSR